MDPTECGTMCSALKCQKTGCSGAVLPPESVVTGYQGPWSCQACSTTMDHRKVVTIQNCGSQLVHMREATVDGTISVLEKLQTWFHPSHYILNDVKMSIIKEWGDKIPFQSLSKENLEMKLLFCEELEKVVEVLEGSLSRTKGFINISYLKTLDFMKLNDIMIKADRVKKVNTRKKELLEIFRNDYGVPENFNSFTSI